MFIADHKIWLNVNDLDKYGQISRKTIDDYKNRKNVQRLKIGGLYHYRLDSLPKLSREKIQYNDTYLKAIQKLNEHHSNIVQIIEFIEQEWQKNKVDLINSYRGISTEAKINKYARKESIHFSILKLINRKFSMNLIHEALQEIPDLPFKCKTYPQLSRRLKEFKEAIESDAVKHHISDKRGGKEAGFNKEHEKIVLDIYKNPQKIDKRRTWVEYKQKCEKRGMKSYSLSTVKNFLNKEHIKSLTFPSRHGQKPDQNDSKYRPHAKLSKPNYSFSAAAGDGLHLGRSVIKPNNKIGNAVFWPFTDWKSGAILGYSIGSTETSLLVRNAFKNILKIHNGNCPKSVIMDKVLVNRKENIEFFDKLGISLIPKRPYNPKSNPSERINKELNKIHRQIDPFWVSVTNNSIDFKHNDEHLKDARPLTWDEYKKLINRIVNIYNNEKLEKFGGLSRLEYLEKNTAKDSKVISITDQVLIFGSNRITTIRNGFIYLSIGSKKYTYEVPEWFDVLTKVNKGCKVRVYFDEEDLQSISIFNYKNEDDTTQDTYLCDCCQANEFNPIREEQTEEDIKALNHSLGRIKKFDSQRNKAIQEYDNILVENDLVESIHSVGQQRYKELEGEKMAKLYSDHYLQDIKEPSHQNGSNSKLKSNSNELKAINPDV